MAQRRKRKPTTPRGLRVTVEQLAQVANLAALQFGLDEIAMVLGVNPERLLKHGKVDAIYWAARLRAQAEMRDGIYKAAKEGDAQAQKLMLEWARLSE